jgi:hypothetical protein
MPSLKKEGKKAKGKKSHGSHSALSLDQTLHLVLLALLIAFFIDSYK